MKNIFLKIQKIAVYSLTCNRLLNCEMISAVCGRLQSNMTENYMRWNEPKGEEKVHSCGPNPCSLDAKYSKDRPGGGLYSEQGLKAPYQNIPACALVPAWLVCYLRKVSVTGNPQDRAVGLSHSKLWAVLVRGHGRSCGGSHAHAWVPANFVPWEQHQCSWGSDVGTDFCRSFSTSIYQS